MEEIQYILANKIAQLNVQLGDYVNAGDVLCVFDAEDLKAQIKTLEDQLNSSNSISSKQQNIYKRNLEEARSEKETQNGTRHHCALTVPDRGSAHTPCIRHCECSNQKESHHVHILPCSENTSLKASRLLYVQYSITDCL